MLDTFTFHEYRLTEDIDINSERYNLTPYLLELLESAAIKSMESNSNKTGKWLAGLVKQYPGIPIFKNYLLIFHQRKGDYRKVKEINEITARENPDYLFGKITLANQWIEEDHPEKVPDLLGATLELKDFYPEREVFHVSELKNFLFTVIRYYSVTRQLDLAREKLKILIELAPDDPMTMQAEEIAHMSFLEKIREDRLEIIEKFGIGVGKPVPYSSKTKLPKFNHEEILELYEYELDIPVEILNEILQLPRETLIADLETLLHDAVERYHLFNENTDEIKGDDFAVHALFLLAELKAEDSLYKVLQFLSYEEDFLDFWLGDHLTETIWQCIYSLVANQLEAVKPFILEQEAFTYAKSIISEAVGQLVLHHPERRSEAIDWYSGIFTSFAQRPPKQVDPDLIGMMVDDAIRSGLSELLPEIKILLELEYFDQNEVGDYNEIVKKANGPIVPENIRPLMTIFGLYEFVNTTWLGYNDEYDEDEFDESEDELDDFNDDDLSDWGKKMLRISSTPKPGRNDPCPCGSGKKFKKCCMEKEEE
jgi:hypothetical protein